MYNQNKRKPTTHKTITTNTKTNRIKQNKAATHTTTKINTITHTIYTYINKHTQTTRDIHIIYIYTHITTTI